MSHCTSLVHLGTRFPLPKKPLHASQAQQRLSRAGSSSEDSCAVSYVSNAPRVCTLPPSHVEAGCTAIVACVRGQQLVIANAGDSRAVLCRAGNAVPLSEDHKPSLQSESQRIQQAGGWITVQGRMCAASSLQPHLLARCPKSLTEWACLTSQQRQPQSLASTRRLEV